MRVLKLRHQADLGVEPAVMVLRLPERRAHVDRIHVVEHPVPNAGFNLAVKRGDADVARRLLVLVVGMMFMVAMVAMGMMGVMIEMLGFVVLEAALAMPVLSPSRMNGRGVGIGLSRRNGLRCGADRGDGFLQGCLLGERIEIVRRHGRRPGANTANHRHEAQTGPSHDRILA
jgi:hypothetical protein